MKKFWQESSNIAEQKALMLLFYKELMALLEKNVLPGGAFSNSFAQSHRQKHDNISPFNRQPIGDLKNTGEYLNHESSPK